MGKNEHIISLKIYDHFLSSTYASVDQFYSYNIISEYIYIYIDSIIKILNKYDWYRSCWRQATILKEWNVISSLGLRRPSQTLLLFSIFTGCPPQILHQIMSPYALITSYKLTLKVWCKFWWMKCIACIIYMRIILFYFYIVPFTKF